MGWWFADGGDILIERWIHQNIAYTNDHTTDEVDDIVTLGSVDARLEQIMNVLESHYFYDDRIDQHDMKKRAIKSYVDGLDDPFTVYLDAAENEELEAGLVGEEDFEGIGARVVKKDQGVMIEEVLKWSPALEAGLRPLDIVVAIDGVDVDGETLRESVERIRGPKDTIVSLTVRRWVSTIDPDDDQQPEILTIDVTRGEISYPSVRGEVWDIDTHVVWHIMISSVGDHTEDLFRQTVLDLRQQAVEAVVLDLRGNGGWFLDEAVEIVSYFLPKDEVVVRGAYRVYRDDVFLSHGYDGLQGLPVIVMVDDYTASAGEIIALALRDQIDATIIGSSTFGKGTIQTLTQFDDGSSLKYTVGERLPPNGESINGTGIIPDVEVTFDVDQFATDATDNQIEYVKTYVKNLFE